MRTSVFLAVTLAFCLPICAQTQDRAALNALFDRATQLESTDPAGANQLYEQGARQGHAPSMAMLGYRLVYGIGGPQDLPRAFSLFTTATKAGNLDGQFLLALCYLEGLGTSKNPAAARENLLDPADQGNQYAQYTLGIMLQAGEGGPQREAAARRWLDRAAGGPDRDLAARAADFRNKLDAKLFSPDNSTGKALTALLFIALLGVAMEGGGSGGGTAGIPSSPLGGSGMGPGSPVTPPPPRPTTIIDPTNPTKAVNGNLTDPGLVRR
jgi:Sel1 repeat